MSFCFLFLFFFLWFKILYRQDAEDEHHSHHDHRDAHRIHEGVVPLIMQGHDPAKYLQDPCKDQDASGGESDAKVSGNDIEARDDIDRKT